ncbi:hypothetical protein CIRG_03023 [Coccidioides immitis RMSCC 2394]|uniref:Uncharacterized protein n=1 Tax=Coccidioides immitis RMSCC 2394 TaxID=404692 RepID=A0A0J6Y3U8_COCIT|nr:hypothetical protein CIRG_03023 [Coccidioides immitis RMSCC 2394]
MDFPRQIRQETRARKMDHNHRPFSQFLAMARPPFPEKERVQGILGILESFAKVSDTKSNLHLSQKAGNVNRAYAHVILYASLLDEMRWKMPVSKIFRTFPVDGLPGRGSVLEESPVARDDFE